MLIFSLFAPAVSAEGKHDSFNQDEPSNDKLEQMKEIVGEHESLLEREPTIHPSLLRERSGDAVVDVIIQFSEAPVALAKGKKAVQRQTFSAQDETNVKKSVQAQQKGFDSFIESNNISFTKGFSYDTVLNGMSGTVKRSDLEKLLEVPGILSIEPNSEMYALETPETNSDEVTPFMDQTTPHLGAPELWERGITGEGVKVAVLDTGIDYDHPDLEDAYVGGHNFIKHDEDEYTKDRDDDDPYETSPSERPEGKPEFDSNGRSFYTTHGTHVAGTIAAQGNNEYGIKGIAPDVELYAYRVLGAYGSGFTDGIIAGIEKSVEEDMDIINLSLGGVSNDEHSPDAVAINNAALDSVTPIIANGNAGPGRGTIGTPATATLGIAVGNSTPPEELKEASVHVEAGDYSKEVNMSLMAWNYGSDPADDLTGELEIVAIPGVGNPDDFKDIDVEGKIALIARGDIAFVDKIFAARDAGAVGTLIHNNDGTGPADVFLSTAFNFLPSFDMATEDGNALREALEDNNGTVSFGDFKTTGNEGNEMSESSSQGPSTPNFDIKPDVVAPGSNIMSTVPAYQKDFPEASFDQAFDRASGTSMAAPHVAAVAALVKQENPDFDPHDIKVALSNTAKLLDTDAYDVFEQGAGLVQPVAAVDAEAYAYVLDTANSDGKEVENVKGTVTFGYIEPKPDETITITKDIELKNMSGESSEYDVSVDVTKAATGAFDDAKVTVDKESVSVGDSEKITVSLEVPAGEAEDGNELLGYIHISNNSTDLSLPFAASFSGEYVPPTGIDYFTLSESAIATDSDGSPISTEAEFRIFNEQSLVAVELYDANNLDEGSTGMEYIGYYIQQPLLPGGYRLEFDEEYIDKSGTSFEIAPDGVYGINLFTLDLDYEEDNEMEAPFYIKSTNPNIEFDENEEQLESITGTINDQFVDFKEPVEENIGVPYDVNEHLEATYGISNGDEVVTEDETLINDDGTFDISMDELDSGDYTLTLSVEDRLGHTAEETIDFSVGEKPEEIDVTLSPSTTEPTEGPITIEVTTNSESDITEMKWLDGVKDVADFENDGETIDIDASTFEVSENGSYTVYVKNENDTEAVGTIDIANIETEEDTISIDLSSSPTEQTEGSVTIDVNVDSETDLTSLKWIQGEHDVDAFADNGEDIDLEEMAFEVDENAVYTVFAENENGTQEVQNIAVTNITHPEAHEFDLSFEISPEEETEGPVTITVDADSEADLTSLKWLPGVLHSPDAFEDDGNDIDLESKAFEVDENGYYTVLAQNSEEEISIAYVEVSNIIVEEEPTTFNVSLEPSTTEDTEDPVTVHVTHDSETAITDAKWLPGEHSADDFADAGNEINLGEMSFDVTENGSYTVFVQNEDDVNVVEVITVDNITEPEPEPEPTPEPIKVSFELSKDKLTDEPITISVLAESKAELTNATWLEGRKSLEDVRDNGNALGLDTMSFVVSKNGTYSVYVQNSDGTEVLKTITITNIIDESPEDPEKPGVPGDPADPDPCIPCDDDKGDDGKGGDNGDNGTDGGDPEDDSTNGIPGGTDGDDGKPLPSTATNIFNYILFGTILTIAGGLSLYAMYRRKKNQVVEIE